MAKRLNIEVSDDTAELISRLAKEQNVTTTELVRRTLRILKAADKNRQYGREHLGFVKDPGQLDVELMLLD